MSWFWGLAGAFIFAAMELLAGLFEARAPAERPARVHHLLKFFVALATGAICAEAFTPWATALPFLGDMISNGGDPGRLHGIAAMIGLMANSAAPRIAEALNKKIVKKIEDIG